MKTESDKQYSVIRAIATGNPELTRPQSEAADFMEKVESTPRNIRTRIRAIYERSGIDQRFSCIPDYDREAEDFEFYPKNWRLEPAPSTEKRNKFYRDNAVPLGIGVAREAINKAGVSSTEITHVITVSCTGFFAPGLDIELCGALGLGSDTARVHVGFMGCYAAFNALKTAHAFCQSDPNAIVLIVCVELCTLHFQASETMEDAVINSLFSDGAAAVVLSSESKSDAVGKLAYTQGLCMLDDASRDHMTWDIGNTGFNMGLSRKVPEVIAKMLPEYIGALLAKGGVQRDGIDFWAVHPGGRAVVEKAMDVLGLSERDVFDSMEVLRLNGNMSSPTILFILKRMLDRQLQGEVHRGVALAFGPGLTIEGCLLEEVPA